MDRVMPRYPTTANVNAIYADTPVQRGSLVPLSTYGDGSTRFDPQAGILGMVYNPIRGMNALMSGDVPMWGA